MKRRIILPGLLLVFVFALFLASFGNNTKKASEYTVTINCDQYSPASIRIPAGTIVLWRNTCGEHTVTSTDGSFDSGVMRETQTASHEFNDRGMYLYECSIHKGTKTGEIVVQ